MSRYIDTEMIHYKQIRELLPCSYVTDADIDSMPTADVVPVVRCKDCIWFRTIEGYNFCRLWYGFVTNENGFCHKADKKVTE